MGKSLIFSFSLIGQVGFATAIPLVIFSELGKYLDGKFQTSPYLFYVGIAFASLQIFFYLRMIVKKASIDFEKIN